jgi:hypothetical protein
LAQRKPLGPDTSLHPEARQYAKKVKMPAIAQVFIILNLTQRISATFNHLLRRDEHPLKFFSRLDKSVNWLEKF